MHFFVLGYGRDEVEVHKNAEKDSARTSLLKRKRTQLEQAWSREKNSA